MSLSHKHMPNRHGNPHRDDAHLYQRMKQLSNRSPIVSQLAAGIKPRTRPWVVQHATTRLASPQSNWDTTETNDIEWKMSEQFKGINIENFYQGIIPPAEKYMSYMESTKCSLCSKMWIMQDRNHSEMTIYLYKFTS